MSGAVRTLLISVLLAAAGAGTAEAASPTTIGYRGNPTHDSRVTGAPAPPLGQLWATNLGAPMSYPVVAEGLVFVSVRNEPGYGTQIFALDAATGAVRWQVDNPGVYWIGGLAYDAGRLYVLGGVGDLRALTPATGAVQWAIDLGQGSYFSPPVAFDGKVYTVVARSGASLVATDGASGAQVWQKQMPSGGGAPAVDQDRIYISMACRMTYAYARATGDELWHTESDCSGGGDYTPVVYGNRLWPLGDNPAIYDTATGAVVGNATFEGAIGVADGAAYVPMNGALLGVDAGTWATRWTFGATGVNNEAPLIGNTHVYVQTGEGAVLALDRGTGAPAWCAGVVHSTTIDEHKDSHMGAGDGRLFVPSGTYLVAYGSGGTAPKPCDGIALAPPSQGPLLSIGPNHQEIVNGRTVRLDGRLVGATATEVEIQSDAWPFDGRWRTRAKATIQPDSTFAVSLKPRVNTRYRALSAGLTSDAITVYSNLAYRFKTRNVRGGRFRETVTLTGPRTPRLTARRLHLYLIKAGSRTARLAASPRITGRYRATATLRYLRPRAKTIVIACYRETTPDAWGPKTDLDKACGRKRLRFTKPARR
jgi:outer membrane protein assembly factor BamB